MATGDRLLARYQTDLPVQTWDVCISDLEGCHAEFLTRVFFGEFSGKTGY